MTRTVCPGHIEKRKKEEGGKERAGETATKERKKKGEKKERGKSEAVGLPKSRGIYIR